MLAPSGQRALLAGQHEDVLLTALGHERRALDLGHQVEDVLLVGRAVGGAHGANVQRPRFVRGPRFAAICTSPSAKSFNPKFPPITYEAYLNWWYQANYDASIPSDDASRESVGIA